MQLIYRGQAYNVNPQTGERIGSEMDIPQGVKVVKMSYRGQSYSVHPHVAEPIEYGVAGCYRGVPYQLYRSTPPVTKQAPIILRFRGAAYVQA